MQKIAISDKCGVLFDMDGVVVDTSAAHYEAWVWAANEIDITMTKELFEQGFGCRNIEFLAKLSEGRHKIELLDELDLEKEKKYREFFAQCSVLIPGIKETLMWLKEHNVPVALGTSAPKQNVDDVYAQWGLVDFFEESVTAECVTKGKPDPEVFLTAANRINREANECIIFEDSSAGLMAAVASKAQTVAILSDNSPDLFKDIGIKASVVDFRDIEFVYEEGLSIPKIL